MGEDRPLETVSGGLDRATLAVAGAATVGLIMAVLDTTIVNVALDRLSADLDAPLMTIQWVSTGYLLSLAVVIPLSGWITERFGSKRTWIASIVLFALGSALCGLATSAGELIAFRILQGLGGGMLTPVGFTLIAQAAGPQRVGRALGLIGVPILLGPIFGPIIGGLIVDNVAWEWIFYVNIPIAVIAIVLAVRVLQPDAGRADAGKLDWLGVALLCPGLAGIVFGLSQTEAHGGIGHPIAFGPIVAGLVLIALFARHTLRVKQPLIDLRLFSEPAFRAAALVTFLLGAVLFGTLLMLPLYFQVARGESALDAGLLIAPQGVGAALILPISGRRPTASAAAGWCSWDVGRRGGDDSAGVRDRPHPVRAARPGAVRARHGSRRLDPACGCRCLCAARVGAGAARHRRAQHAAPGGRLDRYRPARRGARARGGRRLSSVGHGSAGVLAPLAPADRARIEGPVATAFGHTFLWSAALSFVVLIPAFALVRAERAGRRSGSGQSDEATPRIRQASAA